MSCTNKAEPFALTIKNNTLDQTGGRSRGILLGVGTPQQFVAADPNFRDNDTSIRNPGSCNETEATCITLFGGWYVSKDSSTFEQQSKEQWNGSDIAPSGGIYFRDTLSFGAKDPEENYRLMIEPAGDGGSPYFGLGRASTFLSRTMADSKAPSKIVGFNSGSRSIPHPRDGDIVVGGYDKAIVDAKTMTSFKMVPNCGICLTVESLDFYPDGGKSTKLNDKPFLVDLTFAPYLWMYVPSTVYDNLPEKLDLVGDTDPEGYYWIPQNKTDGHITVEFTNFTTTLPSHEVFSRRRKINDDGSLYWNTTLPPIVGLSDGGNSAKYTWGLAFMSQHYLIVDWEREEFQIGRIKDDIIIPGTHPEPQLKALCGPNDKSDSSSGGSTGSLDEELDKGTSTKSGPNTGAIAGGVIGGVAVLAIIAALVWFCMRRRKRQSQQAAKSSHPQITEPALNATNDLNYVHEAYTTPSSTVMSSRGAMSEMGGYYQPKRDVKESTEASELSAPLMRGGDVHEMDAGNEPRHDGVKYK